MAIVDVRTLTLSNTDEGIHGVSGLPTTINTAMVSPIARPTPSINAARMPEDAAGNTTFVTVCQLVAPRARDASLYDLGTALKLSSVKVIRFGRIIMASTITPASNDS